MVWRAIDCPCRVAALNVELVDRVDPPASGCCPLVASSDARTENPGAPSAPGEAPCDGCECSLACCGMVKTVLAQVRGAEAVGEALAVSRVVGAAPGSRGSPHLHMLKRPPRSVTTAS